uniref:Putative secreted protein n=1 Tax=Panstrongylus lignarius TaxID=156445 RepID=A0A224XUZ6_9HEMI
MFFGSVLVVFFSLLPGSTTLAFLVLGHFWSCGRTSGSDLVDSYLWRAPCLVFSYSCIPPYPTGNYNY